MPLLASALDERFLGMVQLLSNSNRAVMRVFDSGQLPNSTRFVAYSPSSLSRLVAKALNLIDSNRPVSLDLGCGNGGWALLAAAADLASFGIDINSFLVTHAARNHRTACERGLIKSETRCEFVVGNMYPPGYQFQHASLPNEPTDEFDSYQRLSLNIEEAGIIYAYAWQTELPLLCHFLSETVRRGTILVLPQYGAAGFGNQLRFEPLDASERHFCIGRKL